MENLKKGGSKTVLKKRTATYHFLGRTGTGTIADLDEANRLLRAVNALIFGNATGARARGG